MIRSAIEKLVSLGDIEQQTVEGRTFMVGAGRTEEIKPHGVGTILVHSLQAVVDYFEREPDIAAKTAMLHVVSPSRVSVLDIMADQTYGDREEYLRADLIQEGFPFGRYMEQDQMVINLLTMFQETAVRDSIIKAVSGLVVKGEIEVGDDGISQQVQTKVGVSRLSEIEIKNPVMLRPIRTFTEVEQVEAPYVLRIKSSGKDAAPTIAIFEADGGQWKNEAIAKIKDWLAKRIEGVKILG